MNLQQLEYIVALDLHRNHAKAAAHCFVTQPTLSTMVKKLEEELNMRIFEKSQPLKPTPAGEVIVARAKHILQEVNGLKAYVKGERDGLDGEIKLGVIPTLAPYLLPRFLTGFLEKYPKTSVTISELQTEEIIRQLKSSRLDLGIMVTPVGDKQIREIPIFYEPILLYTSETLKFYRQEKVSVKSLTFEDLLLLEEGHCFRGQMENLCSPKKKMQHQLNYQSGSFETLKAMVDNNYGYTLIPELAVNPKNKHVKRFLAPEPVREVSLVVHEGFLKEHLITVLKNFILKSLPPHFRAPDRYVRVHVS